MLCEVAVDFGRDCADGLVEQNLDMAAGHLREGRAPAKDERCGGCRCSGFQEVSAFHSDAPRGSVLNWLRGSGCAGHAQLGQHVAQRCGLSVARTQREVDFAIKLVEPLINRRGRCVGLDGTERQAHGGLRLFNGFVGSGGEQREDSGAKACRNSRRYENRLVKDVGIHFALLRDAAGIDDAIDAHAVLGHALENDPGVEGRSFDCGEKLVLRCVDEVPSQRDSAELGIDEDSSIAVVPTQTEQACLACAKGIEPFTQRRNRCTCAPGNAFEDVANGG